MIVGTWSGRMAIVREQGHVGMVIDEMEVKSVSRPFLYEGHLRTLCYLFEVPAVEIEKDVAEAEDR